MIKLAGFIPDKEIMIRWDCDREKNYTKKQWHFKTIPTYDDMMLAEDEYETLHTDIEELIESPIF
jgi:hypothetical protein